MQDSDPRIAEHYDAIAGRWDEIVDTTARDDVLWGSLETFLPELAGKRVLDVGCGSGVYAARLADRGADVIGIDISESMLAEARSRVPEATFRQADVTESVDCVEDDSVDVVLCQHVFSHLEDLQTPLAAFARVLVDGGVLVVSTHNPVYDYVVVRNEHQPTAEEQADLETTVDTRPDAPTYAETERFDVTYGGGSTANRGTYYRRSVEGLLSPILDSGFDLEDVAEPTGKGSTAESGVDDYPPDAICLRARR